MRTHWLVTSIAALTFALPTHAQTTNFNSHALWAASAGPPTNSEDFSSFTSDVSFEGAVVALNVGTITVSSGGTGFRNFIDATPLVFNDNNGTNCASCFTNKDEPTEVRIALTGGALAFGANLYEAAGGTGEGMEMVVMSGAVALGTFACPNGGPQFMGITSTMSFDAIVMRSVNLNPGPGGEGFGLDNIEVVGGPCSLPTSAYCTTSTSTNGCNALISGTGTPSASAGSGFTIHVANVEGAKTGLIFYGLNGPNSGPWATGSTSVLCVKAPTQRSPPQNSLGTNGACNGALALDWNAFIATHPNAAGVPFAGGEIVRAQAWFRDPPAPKTTNLSDALVFQVCP